VSYYDAWYQDYPRNFRADLLEDSYLGRASTDYRTAAGLKYKILKDNIGYIRYESFADPVGNGNLDEVLSYLSVCNGQTRCDSSPHQNGGWQRNVRSIRWAVRK